MTNPDKIAQLISAGFKESGVWRLDESARARFVGEAPIDPGVYAYVVDEDVCYVGSAQRGLRRRLRTYEITETMRTAFRIRGLITEALETGAKVRVLTAVPEAILWNGIPINSIAGIEEGLIRSLRPRWNIRGLGSLAVARRAG
jgi:hypothetical protein